MDDILISIIIPAYGARETISKTLASLRGQDYDGPREIIVVNSSQDETAEMIRHGFPEVKVVQLEKRVFTGEAKNIGLERARGKIIAFIDSDCVAEKTGFQSWSKGTGRAIKLSAVLSEIQILITW